VYVVYRRFDVHLGHHHHLTLMMMTEMDIEMSVQYVHLTQLIA